MELACTLSSLVPADVVKMRLKRLHDLKCMVRELQVQQRSESASMPSSVRRVMSDKQTVAIKVLARAVGISDAYFEYGLINGFRLEEDVPATGRCEARLKESTLSSSQWNRSAAQRREQILQQIGPDRDDLDHALWSVTEQECKAGWLGEPLDPKQAKAQLGWNYVPAKRFLVVQKGKNRPVDDYTISGANSLITVREKPFMQSLDVLVAQARLLQCRLKQARRASEVC
eukprot:3715677-Amphidinium_carterae.1